jgi:phosphoribosylaminoimidazole-succinocarboxamide synthase
VDEVLTPDSSRFWAADQYQVGKTQESFDKQFLRDWLTGNKLNGKDGVAMSEEVVQQTGAKYQEAFEMIVGEKWEEVVKSGKKFEST